jgi:hypothetical protein
MINTASDEQIKTWCEVEMWFKESVHNADATTCREQLRRITPPPPSHNPAFHAKYDAVVHGIRDRLKELSDAQAEQIASKRHSLGTLLTVLSIGVGIGAWWSPRSPESPKVSGASQLPAQAEPVIVPVSSTASPTSTPISPPHEPKASTQQQPSKPVQDDSTATTGSQEPSPNHESKPNKTTPQ